MEYPNEIKNRLKRAEGQVRGILRMMDEDKHCKDVVSQLSAVRNALDKAIAQIVATNLQQCIIEELEKGQENESNKLVEEAIELLVKSR